MDLMGNGDGLVEYGSMNNKLMCFFFAHERT